MIKNTKRYVALQKVPHLYIIPFVMRRPYHKDNREKLLSKLVNVLTQR